MNLVETLRSKHPNINVIEEIVTDNMKMNTSVQICAKDGTQLYDVSNIRKLKKLNEKKPDTIVPDIVNKIVEYYTNNFQYTMPKEKLVFGFDDEEDETFELNFNTSSKDTTTTTTTNVLQEMKNNNNNNNMNITNNIDQTATTMKSSSINTTSTSSMKLNFDDFDDFDNDNVIVEEPKKQAFTFSMDEDF